MGPFGLEPKQYVLKGRCNIQLCYSPLSFLNHPINSRISIIASHCRFVKGVAHRLLLLQLRQLYHKERGSQGTIFHFIRPLVTFQMTPLVFAS